MVSVWDILSSISPLLAPVLSLLLLALGRIIWRHEERINDLQDAKTRLGRTIYGDDKDIQQVGLAKDINRISNKLEEIEEELSELQDDIDDLKQ